MPSTYAHYKFAKEAAPLMPESAKGAVERHPTLYLIGCHGPDILFYYKPTSSNAVNKLGYAMHKENASPFFERAKKLAKEGGEPSLAYIMGFITHFALDSTCHGYVEDERKKLGITHTRLEVEFDRSLLEGEGKRAVRTKLAEHIKAEEQFGEVIAPFFSLKPEEIVRALKDMHGVCNLFVAKGPIKRALVKCALGIVSRELPDQVMDREPDERCEESNREMSELYRKALPVAAELARDFMDNIDKEGLSARFDEDYE